MNDFTIDTMAGTFSRTKFVLFKPWILPTLGFALIIAGIMLFVIGVNFVWMSLIGYK